MKLHVQSLAKFIFNVAENQYDYTYIKIFINTLKSKVKSSRKY